MTTTRVRAAVRVRALLSNRGDAAETMVTMALAFLVDGAMCCSVNDAQSSVAMSAVRKARSVGFSLA